MCKFDEPPPLSPLSLFLSRALSLPQPLPPLPSPHLLEKRTRVQAGLSATSVRERKWQGGGEKKLSIIAREREREGREFCDDEKRIALCGVRVHTFENFPVEMRETAFSRAFPEKFDVYDIYSRRIIFVNITRADW